MTRVLVACECSGVVRDAFTRHGHDAMSCDLKASETPGKHYRGRVEDILHDGWDLIIAHPPCTHLSSSGARHFEAKRLDGRQQTAIDFFMLFVGVVCPRVAIENPVGIMSTVWRKPDQIIQPYWFGHDASKKTCLWLRGLCHLKPTQILDLPERGYWANQTPSGQNRLGPSPERAAIRSRTYEGIAEAMATQWGGRL